MTSALPPNNFLADANGFGLAVLGNGRREQEWQRLCHELDDGSERPRGPVAWPIFNNGAALSQTVYLDAGTYEPLLPGGIQINCLAHHPYS